MIGPWERSTCRASQERRVPKLPNLATLTLIAGLIVGPFAASAASPSVPDSTTARIGGPFVLVDQNGSTVTDQEFRGKWMLVYFGYTHCPDACPTALGSIAAALDDLDPVKRNRVQALFITVDPERDTAAVVKDYVEAFDSSNILGLTGTMTQVKAAEVAYHVRAQRHGLTGSDYSIGHTSMIHVMDPTGQFVTKVWPEQLTQRLSELVE